MNETQKSIEQLRYECKCAVRNCTSLTKLRIVYNILKHAVFIEDSAKEHKTNEQ